MLGGIFRNIISNAAKFTPKSGTITISAKLTTDNHVEISVNDTGIGMNSTILDNLFNLEINTNRKGIEGEPSTGLGLILCKDFIEKHGGKLWIESEEGKGSTFYFTLPVAGN
jgi:signal transduction histidine kinase